MKQQKKRHGIPSFLARLSPVARREFICSGWVEHTDRKREALRTIGRIPAKLCNGLDSISKLTAPKGVNP
jgi:hypothetical protein